jgi:hypothetical protein
MQFLKNEIMEAFPDHTIVFDVIFESDGKAVDWHVDHESLGPFQIHDAYKSLKNNDFISLHFNLTPRGGKLMICDSVFLSHICGMIIRCFGIFSSAHSIFAFLMFLISPWCTEKAETVFNNMKLHHVTKGAPRISYVVRLAQNDIQVTPKSLQIAVERSTNCHIFSKLDVSQPTKVGALQWTRL